ncbi:MAG: Ig-like domain-containing protein, partial [Bacteroidota bacterium]
MNTSTTNTLGRLAHLSRMIWGSLGVLFSAGLSAALLFVIFMGGCKEESPGIVNVCITPTVIRTSPVNGATNEPLSKTSGATGLAKVTAVKVILATFSTPMDPNSITTTTFTVQQGATPISGTVSYSDTTALFVVPNGLQPNLTYNCTITTGAKDVEGTALASNYPWSFTTVIPYTVTLTSSPTAGGTTFGNGTFNSGSSVT